MKNVPGGKEVSESELPPLPFQDRSDLLSLDLKGRPDAQVKLVELMDMVGISQAEILTSRAGIALQNNPLLIDIADKNPGILRIFFGGSANRVVAGDTGQAASLG